MRVTIRNAGNSPRGLFMMNGAIALLKPGEQKEIDVHPGTLLDIKRDEKTQFQIVSQVDLAELQAAVGG